MRPLFRSSSAFEPKHSTKQMTMDSSLSRVQLASQAHYGPIHELFELRTVDALTGAQGSLSTDEAPNGLILSMPLFFLVGNNFWH